MEGPSQEVGWAVRAGSSLFPPWEAVGRHLPAERTDSGVLPPRLRSCFFCSFYWGLGGEHSVSSGITLKLPPHTGSWLESTGHHGISFFSSQTAESEQLCPVQGGERGAACGCGAAGLVFRANRCQVSTHPRGSPETGLETTSSSASLSRWLPSPGTPSRDGQATEEGQGAAGMCRAETTGGGGERQVPSRRGTCLGAKV